MLTLCTFAILLLRKKIVLLIEVYKFSFENFLIRRIVFLLISKYLITKKFVFLAKLCEIKKKVMKTNYLPGNDLQICP